MHQRALATDFASWSDVVCGSFVPLGTERVGRLGPLGFRGTVDARRLGEIALTEVTAAPHTVQRAERQIHDGGNGLFKLSLQLSGRGLLIQDGREVVLEPGRLALYDTSRPYTLTFDRAFSSYVLMFPHADLGLPATDVAQLTATALGADHHLGRVVGDFLRNAARVLPELDEAVGARLMHNAVDLLTTVVTDALGASPTSAPARGPRRAPRTPSGIPVPTSAPAAGQHERQRDQQRERQRQQVREYIDAHLDDPDLAPAAVASAHFMSVRSLHLLFEGTGTTIGAFIRDRRLEHCRTELEDTVHAERPVAVVGARWGFTDPAHFSRVFRARYGVSPGQYRRRAAAA